MTQKEKTWFCPAKDPAMLADSAQSQNTLAGRVSFFHNLRLLQLVPLSTGRLTLFSGWSYVQGSRINQDTEYLFTSTPFQMNHKLLHTDFLVLVCRMDGLLCVEYIAIPCSTTP